MQRFIRARSEEQKQQRLSEIKHATERLFARLPYHEITLGIIAEELRWSRANLYNYAATKEEIFLDIVADKRDAYVEDLLTTLSNQANADITSLAHTWASVAERHRSFFRYGDMLYSIIETNVSVDRLVEFKRGYYAGRNRMQEELPSLLGIRANHIERLVNAIYHHGVGLCGSCNENPLVQAAVSELGVVPYKVDFREEMQDFIAMLLTWWQGK